MDTKRPEGTDKRNTEVVRILRHRKDDLSMTFEELSRKSGVNLRTLNRLLSGERPVRASQLVDIAEALNLAPGKVLDDAIAAAKSD
jgi:transcriptional regulator with XRE-family HTH domain